MLLYFNYMDMGMDMDIDMDMDMDMDMDNCLGVIWILITVRNIGSFTT